MAAGAVAAAGQDDSRAPRTSPVPEQGAVEREIIDRLAERADRPAEELARELRHAALELPIDRRDIVAILPALEQRYGVALSLDKLPRGALDYVSELALVIRNRLSAGRIRG